MSNHPTCTDCERSCTDWIPVRGTQWVPDLKEVRPGVYKCWACRRELHPDMPDDYISFSDEQPQPTS
jgi:hypothetical protein